MWDVVLVSQLDAIDRGRFVASLPDKFVDRSGTELFAAQFRGYHQ